MKEQKKKIGLAIIIVLILSCLCIMLLYFLNKDKVGIPENGEAQGDERNIQYTAERLKDPVKFFSVEKCIQENVDEQFIAKDMNLLEGEKIYSFAVYGTIENEEVYFIVRVDIENSTFQIEEPRNNINNISQINLETNLGEIKNNGRNTFEFVAMKDEDTCRMYLKHFTQMELENPEEAYQMLEEAYKKERFSNFDEYRQYIEECKQIIEEAILSKYLVNYYDDYIEYVLVDNYNNSYTIKAEAVLDYKIMLDNYTIKVDNYEANYQKLSEEKKVQANAYIFLQMINSKDYRHAYELLDNTFKENNFETVKEFKEYVQNNFFSYNLNTMDVKTQEEGNYYIYETTLKENSSSIAESKKLTIIMKLLEGTDFIMSFNIE